MQRIRPHARRTFASSLCVALACMLGACEQRPAAAPGPTATQRTGSTPTAKEPSAPSKPSAEPLRSDAPREQSGSVPTQTQQQQPQPVTRRVPVYDATVWTHKPGVTIPGTEVVFLIDRQHRSDKDNPHSAHDLAKLRAHVERLPQGALVVVDEEYLKDDPRLYPIETVTAELAKRLAIHRTIREARPDIINSDVCGPCPLIDSAAVVWNDTKLLKRWRDANEWIMPRVKDSLGAISIELYYAKKTDGKPVRGSDMADYRAFHEANVAEARKWSDGKPVYGFVWLRTKGGAGKGWGHYVGDELARFMLDETARTCDGVVLWDARFTDSGEWLGNARYDPNDPAIMMINQWLVERERLPR